MFFDNLFLPHKSNKEINMSFQIMIDSHQVYHLHVLNAINLNSEITMSDVIIGRNMEHLFYF